MGAIMQSVIGSAIGTIFGAAIVLLTIWVNTWVDRRKAAQSWYEQTYITEGIDPLLSHFINWQLYLWNLSISKPLIPLMEDINPVPINAVMRIQTLLANNTVTVLIINFHAGIGYHIPELEKIEKNEDRKIREERSYGGQLLSNMAKETIDFLSTLREELLKIRVKDKHDVFAIPKREEILHLSKKLNDIAWPEELVGHLKPALD